MVVKDLIKINEVDILNSKKLDDYNDIDIESISYDSRNPGEKALFFAAYGAGSDGNEYLEKALDNNYKILITDKSLDELKKYKFDLDKVINSDSLLIKVNEINEYLALVSERFYNFPANEIKLVGVTGTNGKTTTTSLIYECLKAFNIKCGLVGTMEIHYDDEIETSKNTTPDAPKLQNIYRKMIDKGCEYNVMEVSSHSLSLKRVFDEVFEVGVYTNLTEDHLDFHKTMENYRDAKLLLFKKCKNCVLNLDTEYSDFYISSVIELNKNILLYGICNDDLDSRLKELSEKYPSSNLLIATDINIDITGSAFKCNYIKEGRKYSTDIKVRTPGNFSVYNALSAIGTLLTLGYELEDIKDVLITLPGITGRFQTFTSPKGFGVAVDYAHTPDGLVNILNTARAFVKGKIITVFGCGGDRDKLKRPIMGRIVMDLSDIAIVTSDNPRTEEPDSIIDDIEVGMKEFNKDYYRISDRYEATKKAIEIAKEGDFVILAGKGHEDYQIIGKEKIHFSDIENVQNLIKE